MNHQPSAVANSGDDEAEIRTIHQRMLNAWNVGDAAAFIAPFSDDADFVAFEGTHLHGREEMVAFHHSIFTTVVKGSRISGDVLFVRFLSATEAVMHSSILYTPHGATEPIPSRTSIQLTAVAKRAGAWRAQAFMNARRLTMEHQLFLDDAVNVASDNEIAALWNGMTNAWERGSGEGFASAFASDARFVAFDGTVLHGPDAIAAFHQQAFDRQLKDTRLVAHIDSQKQIGNVTIVSATGHIERDGTKLEELGGNSVQTAVVVRTNGTLSIQAFQNTRSRSIDGPAAAEVWKHFDRAWNEMRRV